MLIIDNNIKDTEFEKEVKDLQAGKYEYRCEGSSKNTVFKSFEIEEVEFALVDIIADNFKEVRLKGFDKQKLLISITNQYMLKYNH